LLGLNKFGGAFEISVKGLGNASSRRLPLSNFALQPTAGAGGVLSGVMLVKQVAQQPAGVVAGAAAAEGERWADK
jgi:hypothetical protein